jgi:hypothetical protein
MKKEIEGERPKNNAKDVVVNFINALNKEDFRTARKYLNDYMTFKGVLGTRDGADAYMNDMEKMKMKYDIKKVFADQNDVCIFCDIIQPNVTFLNCGWYHVENDKISALIVIFDPRPVLAAAAKRGNP